MRVNGTWKSPLLPCREMSFGGSSAGKRLYNLDMIVPFSQSPKSKYMLSV